MKRNPRRTYAAGFWEVGCQGLVGGLCGYGVPMVAEPLQGRMVIFLLMVPV
jgi:hypothetical protein